MPPDPAAQAAGFIDMPGITGNGTGSRDAADEPVAADLTEDALALEFSRRYHEELRYVHEWGRWLRWDGTRWAHERTLAVFDLARALLRELRTTSRKPSLVLKIQSAATVAAVVTLARVDRRHARVTEDFDVNPWALNTPAGTVDLRSGEIQPHQRADGLTKVTPVAPVDADAPLWRVCLRTWTQGDAELEAFLHRLAGYCVTGSTKEEVLPIVHGPGGNGKTRFIETLRACVGTDYCTGVAMETLIVTKGEQHPTDLADLRGKRLAIATETEEGRYLAEAKVKTLTGGDRARARYMRKDFHEFEPTHKLVIVGNHRPVLRNVDDALRRRLLLIPFTAVIPPDQRDPDLAEKLQTERAAGHPALDDSGMPRVAADGVAPAGPGPGRHRRLPGIPGVGPIQETRAALTVRVHPEALRPVAELLGFRKPARTVELLEEAARSRVCRAQRREPSSSARAVEAVTARSTP